MKKQNELTKDDLYEVEKILDYYAGLQNKELCKLCETATHEETMRKESNLNDSIKEVKESYDRIKEIREKLEKRRKGDEDEEE